MKRTNLIILFALFPVLTALTIYIVYRIKLKKQGKDTSMKNILDEIKKSTSETKPPSCKETLDKKTIKEKVKKLIRQYLLKDTEAKKEIDKLIDEKNIKIKGTFPLYYKKPNIKSAEVYVLQKALQKKGANIKADGIFGKKTEDALKEYFGKDCLTADDWSRIVIESLLM